MSKSIASSAKTLLGYGISAGCEVRERRGFTRNTGWGVVSKSSQLVEVPLEPCGLVELYFSLAKKKRAFALIDFDLHIQCCERHYSSHVLNICLLTRDQCCPVLCSYAVLSGTLSPPEGESFQPHSLAGCSWPWPFARHASWWVLLREGTSKGQQTQPWLLAFWFSAVMFQTILYRAPVSGLCTKPFTALRQALVSFIVGLSVLAMSPLFFTWIPDYLVYEDRYSWLSSA